MRVGLVVMLLAIAAGLRPTDAHAKRRRRHWMSLPSTAPRVVPGASAGRLTAPNPAPIAPPSSFVDFHAARVKSDLMIFHPDFADLVPALPRQVDRAPAPTAGALSFVAPPRTDDALELARRRDRLLLFRPERRTSEGAALGVGLFGATTMMAAHLPPPLRVIFDRETHLGPAIFDDGGMGAGVAGVTP
ncbi:MAG: hypothetical protein LC659_10475 [Myxococcales bacterium]|nr:hypothetical protein [Myxococcales bacterium]